MLLYGASGHAKVIISCLEAQGIAVDAFFDDNPYLQKLLEYPVQGIYDSNFHPDKPLIISIGNNIIRKMVSSIIRHNYGNAIHPSALIDKRACLGNGSVVFHGAIIQTSSIIGNHAIINTASSIDHDCEIGDFVHVSPNATICGGVQVGEGTHIGAGSTVIQGICIGKWTTIGAGAVVIRDVPDYAVVVGNPGRIIKYAEPTLQKSFKVSY